MKYLIYAILIGINIIYAFDEKLPLPQHVLKLYGDNFYRFLLYILILICLKYDLVIALLITILTVSIHFDYINLINV